MGDDKRSLLVADLGLENRRKSIEATASPSDFSGLRRHDTNHHLLFSSSPMNDSSNVCGPRIVDRYRHLSLVGSGGQCDVYRCYDPIDDQWVALKRLKLEETDRAEDHERFLREPDAMSSLDHPVVPDVFEVVVDGWPKPYFTMELLDGLDLRRVLYGLRNEIKATQSAFPLERLVDIVMQVGDALRIAHDQGFIHRDVKPENIMITTHDQVKLVDWGTSKRFGQPMNSASTPALSFGIERRKRLRLTRAGCCPGTPLYMSPEQVIGHIDGECQLDERSDVFSLGAVLYDCLALTTLIRGNNVAEVFDFTLNGPFVPPSSVGRRDDVPIKLEEVCMRAVAIDREKRYQSVQAFCEDLEQAADAITNPRQLTLA